MLEGGYEEGEDACARGTAGVAVGCQSTLTLPDTAHELGIAAKPACVYNSVSWSSFACTAPGEGGDTAARGGVGAGG